MNPRSDEAFVELVERLAGDAASHTVQDSPPVAGGSEASIARRQVARPAIAVSAPERLVERLRWWYPQARVRRRTLGRDGAETWYVYRDGRWTPDPSS